MYHRLLNICRASACRTSNKFDIARRLCQKSNIVAKDNAADRPLIKSELFPDYNVVYIFRFARIARIVNGLKSKMSVLSFLSMPISAGLYFRSILAANDAIGIVTLFTVYTMSAYAIGIYCTNMILYIYLKEDEKKVILTYVDFWGKRVDVHTTLSDIPQLADMPNRLNDGLYKTFNVNSHDETLKLALRYATHIDKKGTELIFGKLQS